MSSVDSKITDHKKRQIGLFDKLRAFAILIILFHHLPAHSFDFYRINVMGRCYDFHFLNHLNRYFALSIFTFMSGYLLEYRYPILGKSIDIRKFFVRRYVRVYPLYLLSLLIYFLIFTQFIDLNFCTVITNCLGLQIIFARAKCLPVMTLWYIGLIFTYYIIFVLEKIFVKNIKSCIIFLFALAAIVISIKAFFGIGDKRLLLYLPIFMAGIWSNRIGVLKRVRSSWIIIIAILLASIIIFYFRFAYHSIYTSGIKPALFSLVSLETFILVNLIMICFVFWSIALFNSSNGRNPSKIISFISYSSYATYLFHRPVWWLMTKAYNPHGKFEILAYMMGLGIPLAVLTGYYAQSLYDKYLARTLLKRLTR